MKPEPLKNKVETERICLDCGQKVSDDSIGYHNADHTIRETKIVKLDDIKSAVEYLKEGLQPIACYGLSIEQYQKICDKIDEAFSDVK